MRQSPRDGTGILPQSDSGDRRQEIFWGVVIPDPEHDFVWAARWGWGQGFWTNSAAKGEAGPGGATGELENFL